MYTKLSERKLFIYAWYECIGMEHIYIKLYTYSFIWEKNIFT